MYKNLKTSCVFMLSPMSDRYVEIILGALEKLDGSKIASETERLGTRYSGNYACVTDAVFACFIFAFRPDVHMTLEAEICPDADLKAENPEAIRANEKKTADIHFEADSRFIIHAKNSSRKDINEKALSLSRSMGIYKGQSLGYPVLRGDIHDIENFYLALQEALSETAEDFSLHITLSANSPTPD